jgi:twitching motility two-component system response regulator PilH
MGIVLVVEENRTQQIIISKILQRIGLKAMFAGDGVEVIDLAFRHRPQLVILRTFNQGMSFQEICRRLKSDDSHKPALLMFFEKTEDCIFERGSKQGADAYISMLCRPQELVDAVMKLLPQQFKLIPLP